MDHRHDHNHPIQKTYRLCIVKALRSFFSCSMIECEMYGGDDMCGRFTITVDLEDLREYLQETYGIDELSDDIKVPRYNVAPSQHVLAILFDGKKYRAGLIKWGFVPHYAKHEDQNFQIINAKSETLLQKNAFKDAFQSKRCVILADGFYEWLRENEKKQPMRILMKDEKIFPMAGLWSSHIDKEGNKIYTATILTTEANVLVRNVHERMPVIFDQTSEQKWLNPTSKAIELQELLKPYDASKMTMYPVSNRVNQASFDDPICIEKITHHKEETLL